MPNLPIFVPAMNHAPDSYVNVSKQIYRDHYTAAHPAWCKALEEAKSKKLSKSEYPIPKPPPLPVFKKTEHKIKIVHKNKPLKRETKTITVPSLNEIKNALQNLKKI